MTGFGWRDLKPLSWLVDEGTVGTTMHLAFTVDTRAQVHTFHGVPPPGRRILNLSWVQDSS